MSIRYKLGIFMIIKSCENDIPFFINPENLVQK
jgi:hypothetical protein